VPTLAALNILADFLDVLLVVLQHRFVFPSGKGLFAVRTFCLALFAALHVVNKVLVSETGELELTVKTLFSTGQAFTPLLFPQPTQSIQCGLIHCAKAFSKATGHATQGTSSEIWKV
jgi:hypothetical protein